MGNYDFSKDLKVAQKTEKEIAALIERCLGKDEVLIRFGTNKDYDIMFAYNDKAYTVEIKEDFMCKQTGNVCVEYESRGKPSGINATKAMMYFYKIHEPNGEVNVYICLTDTLRNLIKERRYFREISGGDTGSNTKSYLFKLDVFKANTELFT